MAIKLEITGSNQEIFSYLKNVEEHLVGVRSAYDKVDDASKKAFTGATDNTKKYNQEVSRTNGLIEDIEDNIKKWEEAVKKATTVEAIEKYNRKIAEAKINLQEYKKVGVPAVEQVNKQFEKGQDVVGRFEKRIIGVFTAYKLWGASKELLNTGVELDQLNRKSSIVFGSYKKDVEAVAKKTATDMGLTRSEFVGAAADIADLLVPMQFTRKEATVMSTTMVGLSGAIAEWSKGKYNAVEVSGMLGKALLGEAERLKEVGIGINQETQEFKLLYAEKLKDKNLTQDQAKALTVLELIIKKSKDAQEAYRDNTGSLIRTKSNLLVVLKDVKENISEELIPTFNALFGFVYRNIEPIKTLAKILVVLTLGILTYKGAVLLLSNATNIWNAAIKAVTTSLKAMSIAEKTTLAGALLGVIVALGSALLLFRKRAKEATEGLEDYNDELERTKHIREGIKNIEDRSGVINQMTRQQLESYKQSLDEQLKAAEENNEKKLIAAKKYQDEVKKLDEKMSSLMSEKEKQILYSNPQNLYFKELSKDRDAAFEDLKRLSDLEQGINVERLNELKSSVDKRLKSLRNESDSSIEIMKLRAESLKDGREKDEMLESIRYREQQEKFKDNAVALGIIEAIHLNEMEEIKDKYRKKDIEDELKYQQLKAENIEDEKQKELAQLQVWYDREKQVYEENSREMEELNKQRGQREKEINEKYRKQGIQERLDEFDKGQQTELALYEANLTYRRIAAKDDKEELDKLEKERTLFILEQEKKRIEYILKFGDLKNETEKNLYKSFLAQIDAEIADAGSKTTGKKKTGFNFYRDILGMDPDNEEDAAIISSIEEFTSQMIGQIDRLIQAEVEAAEKRRELAQQRVDEAQRSLEIELELSAQGYASNVSKKRQELAQMKEMRDKALKDEEKARKAQALMDTVMQTSSLITASANIYKALSFLGPFGVAAATALIATMLTTFALTRAKISKLTRLREGKTGIMAGLLKGRSHEEGGEIFEVEGGEYHSITPKNKAKKHLPILEAIRIDDSHTIAKIAVQNLLKETGLSVDRSLPSDMRKSHNEYVRSEMKQIFNIDVSKLDETNRLLKQLTNVPAVDGFSDKDYVKYILPNGDQKWIKKQG